MKPVPWTITENNEEKIVMVPNLFTLRCRALIQELIAFSPEINVDRIRALGMLMIYREEKIMLYNGELSAEKFDKARANDLSNDDFFKRNYDIRD